VDRSRSSTSDSKPILTIVSGRPGAGKSTLAMALANALPCPLVSRDEINEGIWHTFNQERTPATRDQVSLLAFATFSRAIELLVSAHVTLVAEAAFQDWRWRIVLEPLLPMVDMKIVHCTVDPTLAAARVVRRRLGERGSVRSPRGRAGSPSAESQPQVVKPFAPLSLPVPSIHVTTTDGYQPRLEEIVAFIRRCG